MLSLRSRCTGMRAGIAIGGDVFPGSTLSDHCLRYQNIPAIKMIVVLGELGGQDEYSLVEALKQGQVSTRACMLKKRLCCGRMRASPV